MTFEPEVPKRGEMLKVYAKGSLKQSIGSGSKVSVFVKWGLIVHIPVLVYRDLVLIIILFVCSAFPCLPLTCARSWTSSQIVNSTALCSLVHSLSPRASSCLPTSPMASLTSTSRFVIRTSARFRASRSSSLSKPVILTRVSLIGHVCRLPHTRKVDAAINHFEHQLPI